MDLHLLALAFIPSIGPASAKKLIDVFGSAAEVFRQLNHYTHSRNNIIKRINHGTTRDEALKKAEQEILFMEKHNIRFVSFFDKEYPFRLKQCPDAPLLLYLKGNCSIDPARSISIVGTRKATHYGLNVCEEIVRGIAGFGPTVISGLAFGIDTCAHRSALQNQLPTIAVLGHSLDMIYPHMNHNLSRRILDMDGMLISEFPSGTKPDRENFPKRNRIIAGLSDATLVIEAKSKGGALITADIANSYNREVFAVPGRWKDTCSEGCNKLIAGDGAILINSIEDLIFQMGWEEKEKKVEQKSLFPILDENSDLLFREIREKKECSIDHLVRKSGLPPAKVSTLLFDLELRGWISRRPGPSFFLKA